MAQKSVINVKCPCCKHVLEIDVEKERVVAHRKGPHLKEDAQDGEDAMDVAVRAHQEAKTRVEDEFAAAEARMKNQGDQLDQLFKQAQEKAKNADPEEDDPDNPFAGGKKLWD